MKISKKIIAVLIICLMGICSTSCTAVTQSNSYTQDSPAQSANISIDNIPEYSGAPYVEINNNTPNFSTSDYTTESYETYGELDDLGRCTVCTACIGKDLMPTEKRGNIGMIKPSGWQTIKYDNVDGHYLYNRCHLIGYQLTAENANECNLITGTRYLNVEGMLPFENEVSEYIESSGNHVLYRVTPVFKDSELVARGVQMEAYSVEDNGKGIQYNVYCYNVQPGITIDYRTGESRADSTDYEFNDENQKKKYIVNTNTKKFHNTDCSHIENIDRNNKKKYTGTRKALIDNGYSPCGSCKP